MSIIIIIITTTITFIFIMKFGGLEGNGNLNLLWDSTAWDFPDGSVLKNPLSSAGNGVQSLVRELRFHMLWGSLSSHATTKM